MIKRVKAKMVVIWKIMWGSSHYVAVFKKGSRKFWRSSYGMDTSNAAGAVEDLTEMVDNCISQEGALIAAKNIINGLND